MSNRFKKPMVGFLDLAVSHLKKARTFMDDVELVINWRPIETLLKKKPRRNKDAVANPAYPPLAMFKVLLLQCWYNLSDQGMDDALADRISFRRFTGMSFDSDTPYSTTICRFRTYSDDTDATWAKKAGKLFYGYKVHAATDAEHGFIIGGHVTLANKSDTKKLKDVVAESGGSKGAMVFADKGYATLKTAAIWKMDGSPTASCTRLPVAGG